jgi:hypothetical protein
MLGVLSFKKSLFKGVLDGGEKEVFLGGSRLNRFMETVEAATAAIPEHTAEEDQEEGEEPVAPEPTPDEQTTPTKRGQPTPPQAAPPPPTPTAPAAPMPAVGGNPWAGLIEAGLGLLQQLAGGAPTNGAAQPAAFVQRDERTGESYLRLPVPPPEVLQQAVGAVQKLLESMKK